MMKHDCYRLNLNTALPSLERKSCRQFYQLMAQKLSWQSKNFHQRQMQRKSMLADC